MAEFAKMDPEEYREMKQQERNDVFEMLSASTQSLMDKNELVKYLDIQAVFFNQTVSNTLLIKAQKPDAVWVRSADEWNQDGVYVRKGEHGLKVLNSRPYQKEDGSMGTSYDVVKVFDISQTMASDRPITQHTYRDPYEGILHRIPCSLEVTEQVPGGMDAFYDRHQEVIFVKDGMDRDQTFLALARELACYELMRMDYNKTRADVLPYAECAAYILAKRYGIDAPQPEAEHLIEQFSGKEEKQVRKELSDMKQAAAIIDVKVREQQKLARENKESER